MASETGRDTVPKPSAPRKETPMTQAVRDALADAATLADELDCPHMPTRLGQDGLWALKDGDFDTAAIRFTEAAHAAFRAVPELRYAD